MIEHSYEDKAVVSIQMNFGISYLSFMLNEGFFVFKSTYLEGLSIMKKVLTAGALFASVAVLAACNASETETTEEAKNDGADSAETAAFPITVTDAIGNEITLEEAPARIVTLSPVTTEILYGLDLGDEVVGRTDNDNYPPEVAEKPSVGDMMFSAEEVIALNPDIVFAHGSSMYGTEAQIEQLEAAGVKVFVVENAESMDAIYSTFEAVGEVTGKSEEAEKLVKQVQDEIAAIQAKVEGLANRSAFIVVGAEPDLYVVGQDNYMDEMLELINVENKVTESGWVQFSAEDFVAANPDTMVFTYPSDVDVIKANPVFADMVAVKNGALQLIDGDTTSRQGPRISDGLESMARAIYPEAFNE